MKKRNYAFKYNDYAIKHILSSPYILSDARKEKDIFKLLLKGWTCSQIADKIGYSERTIQNRRKAIYTKTLQFM